MFLHTDVVCDNCQRISFPGVRYKCYSCPNFNVCDQCIDHVEESESHDPTHHFLRLKLPVSDLGRKDNSTGQHDCSLVIPSVLTDRSTWKHSEACQNCSESIIGFRYFCPSCCVSLCERCEFNANHDSGHSLLKMPPPSPSVPRTRPPPGNTNNLNILPPEPPSHEHRFPSPPVPRTLDDYGITIDFLKSMLRRENKLRLGSTVQERYREGGYDAYVAITEEVQEQVAKEFNLEVDVGVELLRCAESIVTDPDDLRDIRNISFYRKYNRMKDGDLAVGDAAPPVVKPLRKLDGTEYKFFEDFLSAPLHVCAEAGRVGDVDKLYPHPCVVIAASHS